MLLALCAMAVCFMFPVASYSGINTLNVPVTGDLNLVAKDIPVNQEQVLNLEPITVGQKGFFSAWPLLLVTVAVMAISLISIFLYKKRPVQMKVVSVGFLLTVADIVLIFAWAVDACQGKMPFANWGCAEVATHYGVGAFLPIVAAVMLFLAQRSIKKDEEMVRAADRLR